MNPLCDLCRINIAEGTLEYRHPQDDMEVTGTDYACKKCGEEEEEINPNAHFAEGVFYSF